MVDKKKIVFNLTIKDLKDLGILRKSKKRRRKNKNKKKSINSLKNDSVKSSSDHMIASGIFNNSNNLINEQIQLQNEALKNNQLVIRKQDAEKYAPQFRNAIDDEFKIRVVNKLNEYDEKGTQIVNFLNEKFSKKKKRSDSQEDFVDVPPEEIGVPVPSTGGSKFFTEGQNLDLPNPLVSQGQVIEENLKKLLDAFSDDKTKTKTKPIKPIKIINKRSEESIKKGVETRRKNKIINEMQENEIVKILSSMKDSDKNDYLNDPDNEKIKYQLLRKYIK